MPKDWPLVTSLLRARLPRAEIEDSGPNSGGEFLASLLQQSYRVEPPGTGEMRHATEGWKCLETSFRVGAGLGVPGDLPQGGRRAGGAAPTGCKPPARLCALTSTCSTARGLHMQVGGSPCCTSRGTTHPAVARGLPPPCRRCST